MPSGTILKTVQKSPIYIFDFEVVFLIWMLYPTSPFTILEL